MGSEFNLIDRPKGSGSSTNVLNSDLFYVHQGSYGGKRVTIVSFRVSHSHINLEYCFEGKVDFESKDHVFQVLLKLVPNFFNILLDLQKNESYIDGLNDGRKEVQIALRGIIGC